MVKPMDKEIIRAYLWQAVIRLGFSPSGAGDQQRWLHQYGNSIKDFWEIGRYPGTPRKEDGKIKGSLNCADQIGFLIEYALKTTEKFNVQFLYLPPQNKVELLWVHDVDATFFCFPPQPFLTHHNKERTARNKFSDDDMEAVVDGLLVHPAAHQHIKSPIDNHEIRIGGGIVNPFVYLFHLRYQLCPIQEKRETEKDRLLELFKNAVKDNSSISATNLMKQPSR